MQLATLTELKTLLEKEDDAQDELLTLILSSVSATIQSFLNRGLAKATRTELYNGGRTKYILFSYPISASSPLTISSNDNLKTIDVDYKVWHETGEIEFIDEPTTIKPQTVSITYTGGYDYRTTGDNETDILDVPDDLKYACLMQAAYEFRNRDQIGITTIQFQARQSVTKTDGGGDLLPGVKKKLRNYRRLPGQK